MKPLDFRQQYEAYGETTIRKDEGINALRRTMVSHLVLGERCLEIGCAEGYMTAELLDRVPQLVAADIAMSYLRRAQRRGSGVSLVCLDAAALPFQNDAFDCLVIVEVLEHTPAPYRVIEELHRILTDDGRLILSVPNQMTPRNIAMHFLGRYEQLLTDRSAHVAAFDYGFLLKLLNMVGFEVQALYTPVVHVPKLMGLLRILRLESVLNRLWPQFGEQILVVALKAEVDFWSVP
jgi:ubiquinone/menaquinone biosynthesis C-methylase UbiE